MLGGRRIDLAHFVGVKTATDIVKTALANTTAPGTKRGVRTTKTRVRGTRKNHPMTRTIPFARRIVTRTVLLVTRNILRVLKIMKGIICLVRRNATRTTSPHGTE